MLVLGKFSLSGRTPSGLYRYEAPWESHIVHTLIPTESETPRSGRQGAPATRAVQNRYDRDKKKEGNLEEVLVSIGREEATPVSNRIWSKPLVPLMSAPRHYLGSTYGDGRD